MIDSEARGMGVRSDVGLSEPDGWVILTNGCNWDGELYVDIADAQRSVQLARKRDLRTALAEVHVVEQWDRDVKLCPYCGIKFTGVDRPKTYCSRMCKERARDKKNGKNPEKMKARTAVRYAVKTGKLLKPSSCQQCGSGVRIQGHHHNGYDKEHRLDVMWLCHPCHRDLHAAERAREHADA